MDPEDRPARADGPFLLPEVTDLRTNTLDSVLGAVADLAVRNTAGGAEASVTLMVGDRPLTFAATGPLAAVLDETQYTQGYGPCLDAVLSNSVMDITDARTELRWPQFTPIAVERGALCSISLPIPVMKSVAAGVNVYGTSPEAFTDTDRGTLRDLVGFASAAIANMHLYEASKTLVEQMRTAAASRAVIDQALGVLMLQHHCTAEEAFDILRRLSQSANRKIRDLAAEIVEQVSRG